jgi:hypothetical protein
MKTLEEEAEKYATEDNGILVNKRKEHFIAGAKWQAERMYSYDELRQIAYNAYCKGQLDNNPTEGVFNLWIQQFKKK